MIVNLLCAAPDTVWITPTIVFNDEFSVLRILCYSRVTVILCEGGRQEETLCRVEFFIKVEVTFFDRSQNVDVWLILPSNGSRIEETKDYQAEYDRQDRAHPTWKTFLIALDFHRKTLTKLIKLLDFIDRGTALPTWLSVLLF